VQAADPEEDADSNEVSVGLVCSQNVALGIWGLWPDGRCTVKLAS
jgi:hypothetical protein